MTISIDWALSLTVINYYVLWMSLYYIGCQQIVNVLCFITSLPTLLMFYLDISWLNLHFPNPSLAYWIRKAILLIHARLIFAERVFWRLLLFCFQFPFLSQPPGSSGGFNRTSSYILTFLVVNQWCPFFPECQLGWGFSLWSQSTVDSTSTGIKIRRSGELWLWHLPV